MTEELKQEQNKTKENEQENSPTEEKVEVAEAEAENEEEAVEETEETVDQESTASEEEQETEVNVEEIPSFTGELDEGDGRYEDATYEGYGPGGIAYFIEVTTNNYNRTVGEIRHIFTKHGGNLGTDGSVGYLFEQKGMIRVEDNGFEEENFMLDAIDAGAEEIEPDENFFAITTARESMYEVKNNLEEQGYEIDSAELVRIPMTEVKVDEETALSNFKLMEKFEDSDDVSNVFTNMKMDDETLAIAENMD